MDKRVAAVKMRNITKTFGPIIANDNVRLTIYKGEILADVSRNSESNNNRRARGDDRSRRDHDRPRRNRGEGSNR